MENTVIQSILNRKSIRSFTGEAVDRAQVELIIRAGMAAPSAMNAQPWAFIAVDDRDIMNAISEIHPYCKMIKTAGAAVIICGDMSKALPAPMTDFWTQDLGAVAQNMLLAIESLGLGGVWCGIHPNPPVVKAFIDFMKLPENLIPFCIIPIGHPVSSPAPKDKFDASRIHWNSL